MEWSILIDEGDEINAVGREGDFELEILAGVERVAGTMKLSEMHFTKHSGPLLGPKRLLGFARDFLRQHGEGATRLHVVPAKRSSGATAWSGIPPKPFTISLE